MTYVDSLRRKHGQKSRKFRYEEFCHLFADTTEELLKMASMLELKAEWIQEKGTHREHFDLVKSKRERAVFFGAKEISWSETGALLDKKYFAENYN